MFKKLKAGLFLILTLNFSQVLAQTDLVEKLMQEGADSEALIQQIIRDSESIDSVSLMLASMGALENAELNQAAYLFYIEKFRAPFDKSVFPPVGTGGNSPMVLLGALSSQIGMAINPEIMRHPDEFAKSLEMVKTWSPKIPEGYDPGWEYSERSDSESAYREFAEQKESFAKGMGAMSTLLKLPEYFEEFKIVQDYNLLWGDESRPTKEQFESAKAKMLEIEKQHNLQGMYFTPE